jgi:hypothetical protein
MAPIVRSYSLLSPFGLGEGALTFGASTGAAAFAVVALHLGGAVPWAWAALPLIATSLTLLPARLDVGGDGFCIVTLGRTKFVPFHDVASIDALEQSVRVRLASGRASRLRVRVPAEDFSKNTEVEVVDVHRALADAWSTFQTRAKERGPATDGEVAMIDGYRARSFREDEAWRIVDDPSTVPGERLRLAIRLREEIGEAASARLYEIAAFVANPPLRAALEQVAQRAASSQQRTPVE